MEPLNNIRNTRNIKLNPIGRLPSKLLVGVFGVLSDPDKIICTLTHLRWRSLIKKHWENIKIDPDALLYHAAQVGSKPQLNLAKRAGAIYYLEALEPAALGGHKDLMILLVSWWKTYNSSKLTDAISWAGELGGSSYIDLSLNMAAREGHIEIMKLLKGWGARSWNWALMHAALGGQIECMKLLKSWGANRFVNSMTSAASGGHIHCMKLAIEWDAELVRANPQLSLKQGKTLPIIEAYNFNDALREAAKEGHIDCMMLARKSGATYICWAFWDTSYNGHIEAMKLLKKWGARNFNHVLSGAAVGGHTDCMKLAKKWGATEFNDALSRATYYGHINCTNLLETWIEEQNK